MQNVTGNRIPGRDPGQEEIEPVEQQARDETKQDPEGSAPHYEDFKLSVVGRVIFFTLAVLTLMVSLDGTSISVALPVGS